MFANVKTRKIEVNKTEAKAIGNPTSQEFKDYVALKSVFPAFELKVVVKRNNSVASHLTYEIMRSFIEGLIQKAEGEMSETYTKKLADFDFLTKKEKGLTTANSFEVRELFLENFPEYTKARDDHKKEINKILGKEAA